jgi:hypothetical protein
VVTGPMNVEGEISSLAAETIALQIVLMSLISQLVASGPNGRSMAVKAFDEADRMAEAMIIRIGKAGRHDHTGKILPIIEQLRKGALGE